MDLSFYINEESGELKPRITKTIKALQQAIESRASESDIIRFAGGVSNAEQWLWFDKYQQYLFDLNTANEHNNHLPIISYDGDEQPIFAEKKVLPETPPRPAIRTCIEVLESLNYYSHKFKAERSIAVKSIKVTVDNMVFDGDETSQTRMSRAILGMKEAGIAVTKWKLADNTVVDVSVKQLAKAMLLAGQEQTGLWGMEDVQSTL